MLVVTTQGDAMSDEPERDPTDEFTVPLDRGMRRVKDTERTTFRRTDADELQDRLDEFDEVRTRGEVESRSARLGGRAVR
jgi:hypothetical protein